MRCPKCGYITFDTYDSCKKCGKSLTSHKDDKIIYPITPSDIKINKVSSLPLNEDIEEIEDSKEALNSNQSYFKEELDEEITEDIINKKKAGFFIRGLAMGIDQGILFIVSMILFVTITLGIGIGSALSDGSARRVIEDMKEPIFFISLFFSILISASYFTFFHGYNGQTLGKSLFKIKVVKADGKRLTYIESFLRWGGYFISSILPFGYLLILFSKNKQGLHDRVVRTYVIRVKM
ncbi:MAG: RDD family protein [bacterium]